MTNNQLAHKCGFVIGLTNEVYFKSVSKSSIVYIEWLSDKWECYRATYTKGRPDIINSKNICRSHTFKYAVQEAQQYFNYLERKRKGVRPCQND